MFDNPPLTTPVPPDDLSRTLTLARPDADQNLPHTGLVGDSYTITVSGRDTGDAFASSICTSRPAAGLRRTGMTSKRRSFCSKANWKLRFGARNPACGRARRSLFPPMRRTSSTMRRRKRFACCASARQRASTSFSFNSESTSPPAPRLLPSSMRNNRPRLWRRLRPSHPSTGLSFWRRLRKVHSL